jgi:hypothetical protein
MIIETAEALRQTTQALDFTIYYEQAPQGIEEDYGTFFILGGSQNEFMGGRDDNIKMLELQTNLFSKADDGGYRIAEMKQALSDLLDWTDSLPVDNYRVISVEPKSFFQVPIQDFYRQFTILHEIKLVRNTSKSET